MSDTGFHAGRLKLFQKRSRGPAPWLRAAMVPTGLPAGPGIGRAQCGLRTPRSALAMVASHWRRGRDSDRAAFLLQCQNLTSGRSGFTSRCLSCGLISQEQREWLCSFSVSVWVVPGKRFHRRTVLLCARFGVLNAQVA